MMILKDLLTASNSALQDAGKTISGTALYFTCFTTAGSEGVSYLTFPGRILILGKQWLIVRCGKNKKDRIIPLASKGKRTSGSVSYPKAAT